MHLQLCAISYEIKAAGVDGALHGIIMHRYLYVV
jgi:hypothetical protein